MELLPGEVPAGPRTLTSSDRVQQGKISKRPCKEQIQNFKSFFSCFYFLFAFIAWATTVTRLLFVFPIFSHLSPTCPNSSSNLKSLYDQNFSFDLHAFLSENETSFDRKGELIWRKPELVYGDLQSAFTHNTNVLISEVGPVAFLFESKTNPKASLFSAPEIMEASTCTFV